MENNKNALIAVMAAAVVVIVLSVATLAMSMSIRGKLEAVQDNTTSLASQISKMASVTTDGAKYLLREYNGVIGVFDETGVLTDIIEVDIKSLPEADRIMLGTGIWAMSRSELAALIEDYTG